jgi:hypothetical protein
MSLEGEIKVPSTVACSSSFKFVRTIPAAVIRADDTKCDSARAARAPLLPFNIQAFLLCGRLLY